MPRVLRRRGGGRACASYVLSETAEQVQWGQEQGQQRQRNLSCRQCWWQSGFKSWSNQWRLR
uniref:hypothetical protein n=1 Tax=Paenibacillus taichungensis TaxID=484184 RepID=UPI0035D611AD